MAHRQRASPTRPQDDIAHLHHRLGLGPAARRRSARKFVQEVNAVTLAVEQLHPDVGSVIELGGQDAKIIIFKEDEKTGDKTRRSRR